MGEGLKAGVTTGIDSQRSFDRGIERRFEIWGAFPDTEQRTDAYDGFITDSSPVCASSGRKGCFVGRPGPIMQRCNQRQT